MKKKSLEKLALTKETVRSLGALALNQVAVGDATSICVTYGCVPATFVNSFCQYCDEEPLTNG